MKISDVIKNISDMVDSTPTERSSGDNTSKFTAFTGDLTLVELPDGEDEKRREPGKMPSGNDEMPEDLYLPPLQLKSELLKKAVDVENVFDDGTPAVRYNEEYGEEGWHGDESEHSYIGAPQTAEEVEGQPDPNETSYNSESGKRSKPRADSDDSDDDDSDDDEERERADESLDRILELALVKESNYHDSKFVDRTERLERLMALAKRTGDRESFEKHKAELKKLYGSDNVIDATPAGTFKESGQHWDRDMYDADRSSKKDGVGSIVNRRKSAIAEWDDCDYEDDEVARGDRELARMKQFVNPANFDADDSFTVSIDDEEEQLDELSKGTLGSYVKKAGRSAGNIGSELGHQRATSDEVDRFTNRHMADKYDTRDALKKQLGASSRDRDDTMDKFGRRTTGIDRAVDRLTRESDEQLSEEAKEMNRMRELAGLNPVVLFALGDDDYPV